MRKLDSLPPLHIFATIGSTRFDELVSALLSAKFLKMLTSFTVTPNARESQRATFEKVILTVQRGATPTSVTPTALESSPSVPQSEGYVELLQQRDGSKPLNNGNRSASVDPDTADTLSDQRLDVRIFEYAPSIRSHLENADIIISHAGSGTILEVLRLPTSIAQPRKGVISPSALVVVPNRTLADDHQAELASALAKEGYLIKSEVESIERTILELLSAVKYSAQELIDLSANGSSALMQPRPSFPSFEPNRFRDLVDEMMGFN